jgi:hypothetical protein
MGEEADMFLPPSASRARPLFGISLAAHAALLGALAVPPLLATQEPPEPDGFVRILHVPMLTTDAPAWQTVALLRKGDGGGAPSTPARTTGSRAPVRPPIAQPRGVSELLPAPTGGQDDDLRAPLALSPRAHRRAARRRLSEGGRDVLAPEPVT